MFKLWFKRYLAGVIASQKDLIVGGQAVMEGVMMRTPGAYAVACRKRDGSIVTTGGRLAKWSDRYKWLNLPILRGGAILIQSMALGVKALNFSAKVFEDDLSEEDKGGKASRNQSQAGPVLSIVSALVINVMLFIVAPLVLTNLIFIWAGLAAFPQLSPDSGWLEQLKAYVLRVDLPSFKLWVAFNLVDGLIRTVFFVIMIYSASMLKDIRRVFEYHGAEHKTVYAWEAGLELTVPNAAVQRRQHPRCGTSFLMVVMIVSIVLFSVINFSAMWLNLVVRIALMPLVAGLSYEVIRYAAKKESGAFFKMMTRPGLWLQDITTQEPDDEQLEVAIRALDESLKFETSAV